VTPVTLFDASLFETSKPRRLARLFLFLARVLLTPFDREVANASLTAMTRAVIIVVLLRSVA
jgi:hypothetical protein